MIGTTIIVLTAILFSVIIVKPKWGSFLIWPILFMYPHSWWYYHQFLPLNIGVDDLFCITLFLVVVIRRNIVDRVPIRFGYAFGVISSFVLVAAVANIAGSIDAVSFGRILYVKDILKLSVYWCLFYAILHCIDDVRDLKIQLTMFSVAAVLGALLVLLQYFFPYRAAIFASPEFLETVGLRFGARAAGAFMNANVAASVLGCSSMLVITAIRLQRNIISKIIVYSFVFLLFVGVMATRSRSGLIALTGGLVLMAFFGRSKKAAWFVIMAGIVVIAVFGGMKEAYKARLVESYDPRTGAVATTAIGRFKTWASYFETATFRVYILGQGFRGGIERNGMESHNVYISLITVYGVGGVIWAIFALTIFFRKVFALRGVPDSLITTVAEGCLWALVVWGIYAMAADALNAAYTRYLLFYLVVLVDRAYNIAQQNEEFWLSDEQGTEIATEYVDGEAS